MKVFFGQGKVIEENIFKYLELVESEAEVFKKTIMNFLKVGKLKNILEMAQQVHFFESRADDLRRNIEHLLYSKVLLPEFRGDFIRLMERLDKLPNECQTILYMIGLQKLKIPKILKQKFQELLEINIQSIEEVIKIVKLLFTNPRELSKQAGKADLIESRSDAIERELIVLEIGSISDYGEIVVDMVMIIDIKAKV